MATHNLSSDQIIQKIQDSDTQKVKVAIVDIDGVLRGKYIHKQKFLSAVDNGFGFCNVVFGWDCADECYDNAEYTGWHSGYPDAQVRVDLSTYRTVPWDNNVPFFLGEFVDDENNPLTDVCPRQLLKSVVNRMADNGYSALCGVEFEWFNFRETPHSLEEKRYTGMTPLTPGMFGYSVLRASYAKEYINALMDDMLAFDVPLEGLHTETGPGVYEAAILYADPVEAADRAVLFKTGAKEIGYRFDIMPSFMAKWNAKLPGCSGHLHQSVWDKHTNKNAFYAENAPYKMSETFQHYLAGQMRCLPEILPFFAPNINSYKRLVEGLWAPTKVNWSADNRTASLRVIPSSEKSTRLETRVPGADINPQLALAAALASGWYGIENKLPLERAAVEGNGYKDESATNLPGNLLEATEKLSDSVIARELFGDKFVEHFVATRRWEWRQAQTAVTDWEIQRYFEII